MPYSMIPLEALGLNELESLPPRVLSGMPLPTRLRVRLNKSGQRLTIQFGPIQFSGGSNAQESTFSQEELEAIAVGVEHGRACANDIGGWIERKATDASFVVTSDLALDGVPAPLRSQWSLGEVLRELDATVVEARVATEVVQELPRAA